ncbi:hypothetical protein NIES4071_80890 [Calothrix sp. NIES-4071]|nr:hypothetical protein NIES4071_80890 [Calothrix sp. NIES-4071]BAZ62359.1 hypothetical protein NIES4105_80820 [Calothrix sp. NIES-4105]
MLLQKSSLSLSLTLLFLSIFTSTVNAQTAFSKNQVNFTTNTAKDLLAQTEETAAPEVITFGPRVGAGYTTEGAGYNPYGSFDIFFPILQNPGRSLTFIEGKMLWDTDTDSLGGNILLGHRVINDAKTRIVGGYVSYDTRNTGQGVFNQLGVGFESLGNWDFHLNGYLPISKSSNQLSENVLASPSFVGNSLQLDRVRVFQQAFSGVDAEVGTKLASWNNGALRGYAGGYVYSSDGIPAFVGVRGRLVGNWNGLTMGLSLQNDSQFDTRLVFNIGASLGGVKNKNNNQSILARMGESVQRESSIIVDNRVVRDTVPAINSNGGAITLFSLADNQLGSITSTLASAKANDIVYVQGGTNSSIGSFTVPSLVQVLSSAPVQVVNTQAGNVQIPGSGTGILPRVTGTVTLASNGSNQTLSGFAITNTAGQPGIVGTNNTNASILQNQVTINGANTNTLLAGRGIVLVGTNSTTNIDSNTVRNAIGEGIRLDNVSGRAFITNNTVLNTIQPQTQTGLEASIFVRNNRGDVNLTIANNTVGDNNTRSSFNNDGTPLVASEIDGIEFSLCRSYAAPVLDTFAKCSGTATAQVAILNNTVRNIGVIGSGDGADGIDINLNNGDDPTDTGARVGSLTISGNRISNIADKGVSFGVDGDAVLTQGIVTNNQVDTVGDIGLALRSRFNSTSNYVATGNTIRNAGNNGIEYILTRNDNNSVSTGIVSNNTISNSGSNGIAVGARGTGQQTVTVANNTITNTLTTGSTRGIDVQTQENGKLQLTLDTNTISGSRAEGIRIRTGTNTGVSGGNSQVNASVKNNNVQSNNTGGTATGTLTASSANNSNFCLALRNNTAGATSTTGYAFTRSNTSIFRVENALLSSNVGTFSPALPLPAATFTSVATGTCGLP